MLKSILSFYFDKITDPLGLPLNAIYEYIVLLILGELAFRFAFKFVGVLYKDGFISGKTIGSILHWSSRTIIYLVVWAIVYWVIVFSKWIIANWILSVLMVGCCIVLLACGYIVKIFFLKELSKQ